ncbi:MAG TPA: M1 family aminopeptidase [Clostridiales bacterium]|nr:M1 family aminopeptidase [Clostridiales bacterium]HQP69694.1 M1 family aminopeptidase [Clostridiales bacterium]
MFNSIFRYELKYSLRMISTHIFFGVMFLFAFLATISAGGTFSGVNVSFGGSSSAKIFVNSPYYIYQMETILGYIGIIFIAAVAARVINRDYEFGTYQWFYSLPLKKSGFVLGRFSAGLLVILYIFAGVPIGMYFGSVMPFVNPDRFCPNEFINYSYPFITSVLPFSVMMLSFLMGLSLYFKNTLTLMIGTIIMLMAYPVLVNMPVGLDAKYWVALFDPVSLFTLEYFTQYITIAEKNSELLKISGVYLYNRMFVLAAAAALFVWAYRKFDFRLISNNSNIKIEKEEDTVKKPVPPAPAAAPGFIADAKKYFSLTISNFIYIIKSGPFLGIFIFWILQTVMNSFYIGMRYETSVYLVTATVAEFLYENMVVFVIAIVAIYSGEVIWRERDKKYDGIFNALPVTTGMIFAAKLTSVLVLIYFLMASNIVMGILIQLFHGYYEFELVLYFKYFMIFGSVFLIFIALLSFVIHIFVNNKYLGYMFVLIFYLSTMFMAGLDFNHPLYMYGMVEFSYSDINGFGYTSRFVIMSLYWLFFISAVLLASRYLWVRGNETGFRQRIAIFRSQINKITVLACAILGLGFAVLGSYIFYSENILNKYETNADQEKNTVQYEKDYKRLERSAQPRIVDTKVTVDIFPEDRSVRCSGVYKLKNMTDSVITKIYVVSVRTENYKYDFSTGAEHTDSCRYMHFDTYRLNSPLFPGDSLEMTFEADHPAKGLTGGGAYYNGTFINNFEYFPQIGYTASAEMEDEHKRKKYGLPAKERMAPTDDPFEKYRNYVGNASWTKFEAVVSTSSDQVAVAPGRLIGEWSENGRKYYRYRTDSAILSFFCVNSGRYEIMKDSWNGIDLEIYYHKPHDYNIGHMMKMMKSSLEVFTRDFGPYQFSNLRIIEFPYGGFAQSFATTIPYSENLGFIIDYNSKNDRGVDYLAYITAHEIGHQWWAHQVCSANTKGTTLLTEVLAQYSSYLVLKETNDEKEIRTFRKYSLDSYLKGRSRETKKELPLLYNENQGYLHYDKGIVVFAAFEDYIGKDSLNSALKKFVSDWKFKSDPYPVSTDILPYLSEVTPDSIKYILDDMLGKIVLYDNKALSAECTKLENGKYSTELTVLSNKFEADSLGAETKVKMNDYINIGLLDKDDEPVFIKKYMIDRDTMSFLIETDSLPVKAGIDPYILLIDRKRDDNLSDVKYK